MSCLASSNLVAEEPRCAPSVPAVAAVAAAEAAIAAANLSEMQAISQSVAAPSGGERTFPDSAGKIKLIATDLDGTFLNAHHKVSKRNAAAFRAAKEAGYTVLVATGRSPTSAVEGIGEETLQEMTYTNFAPGVFMNGMIVYGKDGELLYEHAMSQDQLNALVKFAEDEGLLENFLVYEGPNIWCQVYNDFTAIPHTLYGEVNPKAVDGHISQKKCNKAVICAPDEKIAVIREKVMQKYGHAYDCFYALPKFLEIVPKGANKMTGITYLLNNLGVDPSAVMAIGDSENDCDLLRGIGFPVAVGNACETAKNIAKHVVSDHNKDPFAEAVQILCNIAV